jgi:hypothetical protein
MAQIQVRDYSIWTKHIHGDAALVAHLEDLAAGQTVRLRVAGMSGVWKKMADNSANGAPMQGLKPIGPARAHWKALYQANRGEIVELAVEAPPKDWAAASEAERNAAWAAFRALTGAGWQSESSSHDRFDLHER